MAAQSARGGRREKWGERPMNQAQAPLCHGHLGHAGAWAGRPWHEEGGR